ncbi:MAG TPA: trigger factor [Lacipirellulaceae bacterium]|nr:trigger factor [Lacipirellulaceae bacterium]
MAFERLRDEMMPEAMPSAKVADENDGEEKEKEPQKLELDVQVTNPSACERHVTVTISRSDIDRYFDNAFGEMMPTAAVPGFRIGRAPRKVVEHRFRDEVADQVKSALLLDSLEQISDEERFTAISEPNFDLEAVEVPREGPMTFEFTIEVRPEFELPQWKGLKLNRPMHEFSDADVDEQLEQMLARYGQLAPHDGTAAEGDYVSVNITSTADGHQVARESEAVVRILPTLSFRDARLDGFDKLMTGVKEGDRRSAEVTLSKDAPNEELRGKKVNLEFEVLDVKKLKLPELTEDFLQELGSFSTEAELRDAIRKNLQRQLEYQQQKIARSQISSLLTKSADWELPPGLLQRQSARELERAVMELRRSGFSEAEIRARENLLRQNSTASTATALKEHFILERIAEDEKIDVDEGDYEKEIFLIAAQSGESPRRVRAQLEKRGLMDVLRNQIIERKVLELVQSQAKFSDEPYQPEKNDTEAISVAAGGGTESEIPVITEKEEAAEKE